MKLRLPHRFQAALLAAIASVSFTTLSSGTLAVATGAALLAGQQAQAGNIDQHNTLNLDDNTTYNGYIYNFVPANADATTQFHSGALYRYEQIGDHMEQTETSTVWQSFANNQNPTYGHTLRLTDNVSGQTVNTDFSPLSLGGLIVEEGTYTLGRANTATDFNGFGNVNLNIMGDFTLLSRGTDKAVNSGVRFDKGGEWRIAEGKTLKFDTASYAVTIRPNLTVNVTGGGTLDLSSAAKFVLGAGTHFNVASGTTVTMSNVLETQGTAYYSGNLTLPATLNISGGIGGYEVYEAAASDFNGTDDYAGSGYRTGNATKYYIVKGGEGSTLSGLPTTVTGGGNATIVDGKSLVATIALAGEDTTYYVNSNLTYNEEVMGGASGFSIAKGTVLSAGSTTSFSSAKVLHGTGTYALAATATALTGSLTLGDDWTGTVRLTNASYNNLNFGNLVKGSQSTIEFNGFTGFSNAWNGTNVQNIKLTTPDGGGVAWNATGAATQKDNNTATYSGTWSGDGTMTIAPNKLNYTFTGDISQWTGKLQTVSSHSNPFNLTFTGNAQAINAEIAGQHNTNKMNLVVDTNATFSKNVTANTLTVNAGRTATLGATATFDGLTGEGDIASTGSITLSGASGSYEFAGGITGAHELNKTGAGTQTINGPVNVDIFSASAGTATFHSASTIGKFTVTGNGTTVTFDDTLTVTGNGGNDRIDIGYNNNANTNETVTFKNGFSYTGQNAYAVVLGRNNTMVLGGVTNAGSKNIGYQETSKVILDNDAVLNIVNFYNSTNTLSSNGRLELREGAELNVSGRVVTSGVNNAGTISLTGAGASSLAKMDVVTASDDTALTSLGHIVLNNGELRDESGRETAVLNVSELEIDNTAKITQASWNTQWHIGALNNGEGSDARTLTWDVTTNHYSNSILYLEGEGDFDGMFVANRNSSKVTNGAYQAYVEIDNALALQNAVLNATGANANNYMSVALHASEVSLKGLEGNAYSILYAGTADATQGAGGSARGVNPPTSTGTSTLSLNVAGDAAHTYSGQVLGGISLVKAGAGTQTFSGDMSGFNGDIAVSAGTLALTSTVAGAKAVSVTGGTLDLGAALTTTGNLSVASGATLKFAGANQLTVGGNLTLNGTLDVSRINYSEGATVTLASYTGEANITGYTLSGLGEHGATLSAANNALTLTFTDTPVPPQESFAQKYGTTLGTVQFVGDSITHGSDKGGTHNGASYRWPMHKIWTDTGVAYDENGYHTGNFNGNGYVPVFPGGSTYGGEDWDNRHSAQASGRAHELISGASRYAGNTPASLVANYSSDVFFLMIGTNDTLSDYSGGQESTKGVGYEGNPARIYNQMMGYDVTTETFSGNSRMDTIVDTFAANGGKASSVVVLSIPTWSPNHSNNNKAEDFDTMKRYNEILQEWCKQQGDNVYFVDVNPGIIDVANTDKPFSGVPSMFNDNLHPSGQGDLIFAANIARQLGYAGRTVGLSRSASGADWTSAASPSITVAAGTSQDIAGATFTTTMGYTVDFGAVYGDGETNGWDGAWNTANINGLRVQVGDGTHTGTLTFSEAYVKWGDTVLYSRDNHEAGENFRIAYVNASVKGSDNVAAGYYVWMGDMLIGEALDAGTDSFNGIRLTSTGAAGSVTNLSWSDSAYAPTTTRYENQANAFHLVQVNPNPVHDNPVKQGEDNTIVWESTNSLFTLPQGQSSAADILYKELSSTIGANYTGAARSNYKGNIGMKYTGTENLQANQSVFGVQESTVTGSVYMQFDNANTVYKSFTNNNPSSVVASYNGNITGSYTAVYNAGIFEAAVRGGTYTNNSIGDGAHSYINGGTFKAGVYGGGVNGTITGGVTVTVTGGSITGSVYGGGVGGTINGGTLVTITGGIITGDVNGGGTGGTINGGTAVVIEGNLPSIGGNITADEVTLRGVSLNEDGYNDGFDWYSGTITGTEKITLEAYKVADMRASLVTQTLVAKSSTNTIIHNLHLTACEVTVEDDSSVTLADTLTLGNTATYSGALSLQDNLVIDMEDLGSSSASGAQAATSGYRSGTWDVMKLAEGASTPSLAVQADTLQGAGALEGFTFRYDELTGTLSAEGSDHSTYYIEQAGDSVNLTTEQELHPELQNVVLNAANGTVVVTSDGTNTLTTASLAQNSTLTFDVDGSLTVSGAVSGTSANVVKDGSGTLTLNGNNTFSGGLTVNEGTLAVSSPASLGSGTATVNEGATILLTSSNFAAVDNISVTGDGDLRLVTSIKSESGNALNTISATNLYLEDNAGKNGRYYYDADSDLSGVQHLYLDGGQLWVGADLQYAGDVTFNTTTYSETGTLTGAALRLSGPATFSGNVDVADTTQFAWCSNSVVEFADTVTGSGNLNLKRFNSNGTFKVSGDASGYKGAMVSDGGITLNVAQDGRLALAGGSNLAGAVTLDGSLTMDSVADTSSTISGVVSGNGSLTKDGEGSLKLSGNNTFTGNVTVNKGTLQLEHQNALGSSNASGSKKITIKEGGTIDINGKDNTIYKYTLAGGSLVNNGADTVFNHTQNAGIELTADSSVGGTGKMWMIASQWAATSANLGGKTLTKKDSGTFIFVNTDISEGTIQIDDGTVEFYEDKTHSRLSGDIKLNGGTFTGAVKMEASNKITASQTSSADGKIELTSGNTTTLSADDGVTMTLGGQISGDGALSIAGDGTVVLTGNNNYAGGTTIDAGTLVAGSANALGTGAIMVNNGGTLELTDLVSTVSGNMNINQGGTLKLAKYGDSTAFFANNLTLASNSILDLSALDIDGMESGPITLVQGGTIDGTNLDSVQIVFADDVTPPDYTLALNGSNLVLTFTQPEPGRDLIWDGTTSNSWTGDYNWHVDVQDAGSAQFQDGDNVAFTTATQSVTTVLGAAANAGTMEIDNGVAVTVDTNANNLTVHDLDVEGGSLTKTGAGRATFGGSDAGVTLSNLSILDGSAEFSEHVTVTGNRVNVAYAKQGAKTGVSAVFKHGLDYTGSDSSGYSMVIGYENSVVLGGVSNLGNNKTVGIARDATLELKDGATASVGRVYNSTIADNNGKLVLGDGATFNITNPDASSSLTNIENNGGTLNVAGNLTVFDAVSGEGGNIVYNGTTGKKMQLNGGGTVGGVTVNGGEFITTGTADISLTSLNVQGGTAHIGNSGEVILGNVNLDGGALVLNTDATATSLTTSASSTLTFAGADMLTTTGGITLASGTTFDLSNISYRTDVGSQEITLATASGITLAEGENVYNFSNPKTGDASFKLINDNNVLKLVVTQTITDWPSGSHVRYTYTPEGGTEDVLYDHYEFFEHADGGVVEFNPSAFVDNVYTDSNNMVMHSDTTIVVEEGKTVKLTGKLSSDNSSGQGISGDLTKDGAGTLEMTINDVAVGEPQQNIYEGSVNVDEGTLHIVNTDNPKKVVRSLLASGKGDHVRVAKDAVLELDYKTGISIPKGQRNNSRPGEDRSLVLSANTNGSTIVNAYISEEGIHPDDAQDGGRALIDDIYELQIGNINDTSKAVTIELADILVESVALNGTTTIDNSYITITSDMSISNNVGAPNKIQNHSTIDFRGGMGWVNNTDVDKTSKINSLNPYTAILYGDNKIEVGSQENGGVAERIITENTISYTSDQYKGMLMYPYDGNPLSLGVTLSDMDLPEDLTGYTFTLTFEGFDTSYIGLTNEFQPIADSDLNVSLILSQYTGGQWEEQLASVQAKFDGVDTVFMFVTPEPTTSTLSLLALAALAARRRRK